MHCLQPLLLLKLKHRAKVEPLYGHHIHERFGTYVDPAPVGGAFIWVHAVSLGETRAVGSFISELRKALPGMRLLLTHGTATGRTQGQSLLEEGDVQVWQPWDTPQAIHRFLQHFKPRIGLLVETEVWPNWIDACERAHVPLCLINARFSEKSLRMAQRFQWIAGPAYSGLSAVWAQTEQDAARLRSLGANVKGVLGNFKFDQKPNVEQLNQGRAMRLVTNKAVVMLASSREGEEQMLLDALKTQTVQWLVVPRHPQRFEAVAKIFESAGLSVARRSQDTMAFPPADVWIGDSLGEMSLYFGLADVALLGGSFAPLGGQNLIEAAACGCPVVMGPHTFNFAQAAELAIAEGAAVQVNDMAQGVEFALNLSSKPKALESASSAALAFAHAHQGAALRASNAVVDYLKILEKK
jgi:3-deoxy-D-manno-octulosonic-acid transferase